MREKIHFHLLILCGIWSHGIIGTFADEEIKESSNFLVRHKRVVSYVQGEDNRIQISDAKHVAIIKYLKRIHCTGSILSHLVVITSALCVQLTPDQYQIMSSTTYSNQGKNHNVIDIRRHLAIALVITGVRFTYGAFCNNIQLHVGPLQPGTVGQVSGWGFNYRGEERGTNYPRNLRSIQVPILAHRNCVNRYQRHDIEITDHEVCTYHPQRHSGHSDFGAGLVVNGYLAGVLLWSGLNQNNNINPQYPEVFAAMQHPDYNHWISSNVQEIGAH